MLATVESQFGDELFELRASGGVEVVAFGDIEDDHVHGWQTVGIGNLHLLTKTSDLAFALDRPDSLGFSAVACAVGRRMVGLDVVQDRCFDTVSVGEEEGFMESEDAEIVWNVGWHDMFGV